MLPQETTCKGLQTMFVKTIQSAFKEIELFRYFSCMVSKKKMVCLYKIVSFNDLNHFFFHFLNKNVTSKEGSSRY